MLERLERLDLLENQAELDLRDQADLPDQLVYQERLVVWDPLGQRVRRDHEVHQAKRERLDPWALHLPLVNGEREDPLALKDPEDPLVRVVK